MDALTATDLCRYFREEAFGTGSTVVRGLAGSDPVLDFALSTAAGLASNPRHLDSRFLYDAQGSALFDLITEQPEYYLTRTEEEILASSSTLIREMAGGVNLVELGSGSSAKTDHLLRAWLAREHSVRYVPVDVSESALRGACQKITNRYSGVRVTAINADYRQAFTLFKEISPVMVLFLGSTIGNFSHLESSSFLQSMALALKTDDFFLLGLDLVKDPHLIEAAYNDAAGVTVRFTRNLFARMNRELGTEIDLATLQHEARYNPLKEQVETRVMFTQRQTIRLRMLGESFAIAQGERVLVEISRKFRLEQFVPAVEDFGFATEQVFTDAKGWFALLLLRRTARQPALGSRL